jgi:PAS domain S-box-containing protein
MGKEVVDLASRIFEIIAQPAILANRDSKVISVNDSAKKLFDLNIELDNDLSLDRILDCNGSLQPEICKTNILCDQCNFYRVFKLLDEESVNLNNQTGTVVINTKGQKQVWRINFDAHNLDKETGYYALFLNTAIREIPDYEKSEINAHDEKKVMLSTKDSDLKSTVTEISTKLLFEHEACLNSLFLNSQDGMIMVNKSCEIIKWNQQYLKIAGLITGAKVTSEVISESLSIKDQKGNTFIFNDPVKSKENCNQNSSFKGTFLNQSGNEKCVSIETIPYFNIDNTFNGALLLVKDLSNEQKLKTQMELHRYALEYSPNEFFYINSEGDIIYANKTARDLYSIDEESFENYSIVNINLAGTLQWWKSHINKLIDNEYIEFETFHQWTDGHIHPVAVTLYRPDNRQKDVYCYLCHSISDNKRIEETLMKESRVNSSLAEIGKEISRHNNLRSIELLVRQYSLEITESSFAFLAYRDPDTNETILSVYSDSPENYEHEILTVEHFMSQYFEKDASNSHTQTASPGLIVNDTQRFWIGDTTFHKMLPHNRFAISTIFINDEYKGLLLVAGKEKDYEESDITHLQSLTTLFTLSINRIVEGNRLKESMEQLELAMDVADMGMWDMYPENKTVFMSDRLLDLHGLPKSNKAIHVDTLADLMHPDDTHLAEEAITAHIISNSPSFTFNCRMRVDSDEYKWFSVAGRVVEATDENIVKRIIGVTMDITEEVLMNQALMQSKEEAIAASNAKGVFLARMSHEFRTPLNAIIGFTDLLKANINNPLQLEYLSSIRKSSLSLLSLITDILDYSKIDSGKLEVRRKPLNLLNLIKETRQMFEPSIVEKKLYLRLSVTDNIPEYLYLDELRLRQILINLIGNAIKFTDKGGVQVSLETGNHEENAVDVIFKIADTGIGIKPESQQTIFEDFTQQEDQDNRKYEGTGLGLGIVKRLVHLMGGKIDLESTPGQGSLFTVTIFQCQIITNNDPESHGNKEVTQTDENKFANIEGGNSTISSECQDECHKELKYDWINFRLRPSFKETAGLSGKILAISEKHNDKILMEIVKRMNRASDLFDVEELNKCITDFEFYTRIEGLA